MPRVLLDLRMVSVGGPLHGIARYALELARRAPMHAPGWQFSALTGPDGLPRDLGALAPRIPLVRARARFLSVFEQPTLVADIHAAGADLFHATSFSLPALWAGPVVATLHDANHLALPENYRPWTSAYYRLVVGPRARKARALITVSEFSRSELARHLALPPERFQVIPQGVDEAYGPRPASEVAALRARLGLPPRFLLAMGNAKPHKNLPLLARLSGDLPVPLALLAGKGTARSLRFASGTIELGQLAEEDLPALYSAAEALLFPSLYEGFGLPPLEAMACGCPVIASSASSLPEMCGEAAVLVDPRSEESWREAILRVSRDGELRRRLSERGRERAARFTWERTAERTVAVYRRVVDAARGVQGG